MGGQTHIGLQILTLGLGSLLCRFLFCFGDFVLRLFLLNRHILLRLILTCCKTHNTEDDDETDGSVFHVPSEFS
jgi:hypothetical protein